MIVSDSDYGVRPALIWERLLTWKIDFFMHKFEHKDRKHSKPVESF